MAEERKQSDKIMEKDKAWADMVFNKPSSVKISASIENNKDYANGKGDAFLNAELAKVHSLKHLNEMGGSNNRDTNDKHSANTYKGGGAGI